ncbi:MAG TPA: peptide-methionine (S)-S-oxide reductase MsrA [Mesorhizobium sp.]|jgi:peptide-methionine (S)-S-oxide reductase
MFFLSDMLNKKLNLPKPGEALPGRAKPIRTATRHFVSRLALKEPYPDATETAVFAMGNFHDAERLFWKTEGVWVTAAGFCGGATANPTYQEVSTGLTGHTQAVLVVFDPAIVSYAALLKLFWQSHDPTQGMRQGNDIGTFYRSMIHTRGEAQHGAALASRDAFQVALLGIGLGRITTQIAPGPNFFFAEAEHQQYLAKNPDGAGGLRGTGAVLEIAS